MMAWFGTALARTGYVVIAVDHPGNNGVDPMTVAGAVMFWERPGDLAAALASAQADPAIAPHLDAARLGVAGFSAGGFTSLATVGGRVDVARLLAFCDAHPDDGVCRPQKEFAVEPSQARAFLARPDMVAQAERSHRELGLAGVKAAFVMSPAIIQSFTPESLKRIAVPVAIVLGDADTVAPPQTNGEVAAVLIPGARIQILPGVGHYDFLSDCTHDGDTYVPVCPTRLPRDPTHQAAIGKALALFGGTIGPP